jgi:peptide/nickel transport system permease protein
MKLLRRVLIRLGWGMLTLLGLSLLVFVAINAVPADPVAAIAGPKADKDTKDRIRRELHMDDPLLLRYGRYLRGVLRGDFGRSYAMEEDVADAILTRLPATLALALAGVALWLAIGVPVGVLTARYRGRPLDRGVLVLSMLGISVPTFWLGRMLQFHLAYRHGLFPVAGFVSWRHLILPALTLGIVGAGFYARLVHSSMVEVLEQDYIRAARARGLPERTVLFKHALRNALLPVLTVLGTDLAALLGGVVFCETIFALPGLGRLAVQAVISFDLPIILGTVLFSGVLVVVSNLAVDLLVAVVDPRVRTGA